MFINNQCQGGFSDGFFVAVFREMDKHATQIWPLELALDFVRAFCAH